MIDINIVGKRNIFFIISAVILLVGIISMVVFGFRLGVDFSSGTTMTLRFGSQIEQGTLRQEFANLGYSEATIQRTSEGDFFVRIKEINTDQKLALVDGLKTNLKTDITVRDLYTVSPLVAKEVARNAAFAVALASVFMVLYIAWAFRKMPSPFRWGFCAVVSLLHDVLVVMGIFSILGWVANVQVDAMFITALLTIVGYSINNTCVVFDRIRENVSRGVSKDFGVTVNSSILETITRCINTSLTVVLVALAVYLFGGATIQYFILALLVGVIVGTYDSICISGPMLVVFERGRSPRPKTAKSPA